MDKRGLSERFFYVAFIFFISLFILFIAILSFPVSHLGYTTNSPSTEDQGYGYGYGDNTSQDQQTSSSDNGNSNPSSAPPYGSSGGGNGPQKTPNPPSGQKACTDSSFTTQDSGAYACGQGCCYSGQVCCGKSTCCDSATASCDSALGHDYCQEKCSKTQITCGDTCCDPKTQECRKQLWGFLGYCVPKGSCDAGTSACPKTAKSYSGVKVCCQPYEDCVQKSGAWGCNAKKDACPSGTDFCDSQGPNFKAGDRSKCCATGTCQHDPTGYPKCMSDTSIIASNKASPSASPETPAAILPSSSCKGNVITCWIQSIWKKIFG